VSAHQAGNGLRAVTGRGVGDHSRAESGEAANGVVRVNNRKVEWALLPCSPRLSLSRQSVKAFR
jgi:hypothetical protein